MLKQHHKKKNTGWGIALLSLSCLMQPAAHAQTDAEILESVRVCQNISGLSPRLSCYDRILPPISEAVESDSSSVLREETVRPAARPRPQPASEATAQIIEVQRPSFSTFRLIAADGQVFVQSNATSIVSWPETPFEVQIHPGFLGIGTSTFLSVPGVRQRIRVLVEN